MDKKNVEEVLEAYIEGGKVMHLVTMDEDGSPWMSPVWYAPVFKPDRLIFTSRNYRKHSINIVRDPNVTGSIVWDIPEQLGLPVRGAMFSGKCYEVGSEDMEAIFNVFTQRFPLADKFVSRECVGENPDSGRLYQVVIENWRLHDEENFSSPRKSVTGR